MTQVSVIGLGAMGSVLAKTLAEGGRTVTAWNRSALTAYRETLLTRAGVQTAATPADAVAASPLTIMCVLDHAAAESIIETPGVLEALSGRTLVQLSNVSVQEERRQLERVRQAGARMLVGGIVAYPRHIGLSSTVILYAGDAAAFDEHRDTLAVLAGGHRYMGEELAERNAIYNAGFGFYFGALAAFLENTALAAGAGVPPGDFASAMPVWTALLLDHVADAARRVETGDWDGDQATVDVHVSSSRRRQRTLREAGLQSLTMDAFLDYCEQAHVAGDGAQDIAAIYKRVAAPRRAADETGGGGGIRTLETP
jgi:3-hydroxyisobutyrate dehydrogenase-like beta-hydroxyacid dehydrogenase